MHVVLGILPCIALTAFQWVMITATAKYRRVRVIHYCSSAATFIRYILHAAVNILRVVVTRLLVNTVLCAHITRLLINEWHNLTALRLLGILRVINNSLGA